MTTEVMKRLEQLAQQEESINFETFSHADAWEIGSHAVGAARALDQTVAIRIDLGDQQVFHAALRGTTPDNDVWLTRKIATSRRYSSSSLMAALRFRDWGLANADGLATLGLDANTHALSGGAFPIRAAGSIVGIMAVSGMTEDADHDLVTAALEASV